MCDTSSPSTTTVNVTALHACSYRCVRDIADDTVVINLYYAKQHGYEFVFYHLGCDVVTAPPTPPTPPANGVSQWSTPYNLNDSACWHPLFGQRHPATCKMLPIYDVVQSRTSSGGPPPRWSIFLDTDVIINNAVGLLRDRAHTHTHTRARTHARTHPDSQFSFSAHFSNASCFSPQADSIDKIMGNEGSCNVAISPTSPYGPLQCANAGAPDGSSHTNRTPESWADLLVCFDGSTGTGNTGVQFWGVQSLECTLFFHVMCFLSLVSVLN
jgi:hypothetical protein